MEMYAPSDWARFAAAWQTTIVDVVDMEVAPGKDTITIPTPGDSMIALRRR